LNYSEIRNKYNIDIAYNQLSNIKNKFIEMFFWIQNISKEDIDIIGIDSSYFIKKNKLINTFLYLENNKELICSIEDIISDLNGIIKNDDFWEQFIVYFNYYNSDEFSHNDLNELKSEIIGILADYLFDLSSDL
jgi:hypothetical protein